MSSSVSNISFRYHPEDEQLEDSYETSSSISTSSVSVKSDGASEDSSVCTSSTDKTLGRQGKKEETDKWKILRDVKVRIAKSVEEKLEEIKTERLKSQSKHRRSILGQMENSSVSDSEEQSESSLLSASDKSTKSAPEIGNPEKLEKTDEKPESDESCSQGSTPDRSTTPVPSPDDVLDDEMDLPVVKGKTLKAMLKRKKGKTKSDKIPFEKTSVSYSALVDNDSDSEMVEVAQEVNENALPLEHGETRLARELDRLAHPSLLQQAVTFICDWHIFVIPLVALISNWFIQLPTYMVGFTVGVVGVLVLQRLAEMVRWLLGPEPPIQQLKDMLPLTEVPIFRRNSCNIDSADTVYEGWMNEYTREYHPDTYHITLTETVYVRLEGSKLHLSSPRNKIPKRALWNEPKYNLHFNRERLYDISNCSVELRPEGLIHRRIWSKKYPICIVLSPGAQLGVRYREKSDETVDPNAPWVEDENYNFETVSEDSEDERTVPSINIEKDDNNVTLESRPSFDETVSLDSLPFLDPERSRTPGEGEVDDMEEGFVKVSTSPQHNNLLYLFARVDRQKEMWFRRFVAAAAGEKRNPESTNPSSSQSESSHSEIDYLNFMLTMSQRTIAQLPSSKEQNSKSSIKTDLSISMEMMWLNAFLGRLLFDVYQDTNKRAKIQEKIQRKLSAIKLPMFLEQLEVTQLDLGQTVPIVQRASRPQLDSRGIWVDLDIIYEGGFRMTVDTKVNLNRIKQMQAESPGSESPKSRSPAKSPTPVLGCEPVRKSAVYDSSVEDSAETSSEEPDLTRIQDPSTAGQGPVAQHKYLRLLDKVTQSKYFQQVADYKFIKKFVSGNNLQLIVEVKGLLGTLVLNFPPPPSDRLWYGFRKNPKLWLSAQPKFGQHAVHVISRIIEKRLCLEFQRLLVLPNMDDLLIPIMDHGIPS